jgi:hypothetical protein
MKSFKFLLIAIFGITFLMGCNKLTNKNIIGTWNLTAGKLNGTEVNPVPFTWVVVFNEGNTGTSTINSTTTNMVWALDESAQTITFPSTIGTTQVYTVLEKKGSTLRVEYVDSGNTYEYTFEKQ